MKFFGKAEEPLRDPVLEKLREKISDAGLKDHVKEVVERELELLFRIGPSTSEYTIGLTYIEYLLSMPWKTRTEDILDLDLAEQILDEEHYGLSQIKERVLEHLAVKKLKMSRKPQILIVDDEEIVRRNMSHVLLRENYAVQTAKNGYEALAAIEKTEFDVVLTDFKMDKMDGIELLGKIKAISPGTQVIMITGYATIHTAIEAMKKGAFHYIAKPFQLDDVRSVVNQALEKRAVRQDTRGSVLCFSGPPGTGKTSLGRSIARAVGRKFARISLGGIKDEAEIRGHRRTYAGAMPGRIIDEIRRVGVCNPVIILDELDKIGHDFKGDPASALLEVLDPEQNANYLDHYLDMPFDLSGVMFIITANVAENIPGPLKDRMEVIHFSGYTESEKVKIAANFLVPRQIRENGLLDSPPYFDEDALHKIVQEYTHEAGIRGLSREIASVCRKIAKDLVQHADHTETMTVTPLLVEKLLGPRKYHFEVAEEVDRIGVTTGLVWTDVGGEIIFVEAAKMAGKQELILTGSLGDIMKESARAALSYIRSNAAQFGIEEHFFEDHDIHIHVPAGAIPKDGPSAGSTIVFALLSLLTGRPARRDVALSGEITLSGRILPVGGIKEKLLAAKRAGVKQVILPLKNRVDIESLPPEVLNDLTIRYMDRISEAVEQVLENAQG
ncbi:MAG: endopeptidase La [Nitrospirae bacterium]|nr:endopeptidase La [Nitrospirota bacterium]